MKNRLNYVVLETIYRSQALLHTDLELILKILVWLKHNKKAAAILQQLFLFLAFTIYLKFS